MGNVAQGVTGDRQPHFAFTFSAGSLATTANGTLLPNGVTGTTKRVMPYAGSVYAIAAQGNGTIGGTLTITPVINSVVQTFYVTQGAAGSLNAVKRQDGRVTNFNAGDTLALVYNTTTVSGGLALVADVYVFCESVDI